VSDVGPADLAATALLAAYRAGELSPVEVAEAVLARVAAWEPTLGALCGHDPDAVRAAAADSERRWRGGAPRGPLDGVPVTVKENIALRGRPTPLGSAALEQVPATADAPAAARLAEAGAVLTGVTTMPDLGMLSSGLSSLHGVTRNPWNPERNPGGSSAGAGAAAAAGYGPLHLGTDIGGSVRLPAGWCGVVGFKPSFGRVPVDPPYPGRHVGPLTRTVADAALVSSVISAPDARDHTSLPPAELDWADLDRDPAGLRIGLLLDVGVGLPVDPEVSGTVRAAAEAFAAAGARVEPVGPPLTRHMLDGLDRFWRTRFWMLLSALPAPRRAAMLPFIARWAEGGEGLTGTEVFDGFSQMDAMATAALAPFGELDYLISPASPVASFGAGQASPLDDPERAFDHVGFTVPFNMSGQPAIVLRAGTTADGMPIGVQIVGRRFDDLGVLRLATAWERLRPAPPAWPTPPVWTAPPPGGTTPPAGV
jgi:aspartyl-tRNA(Asn)/glutamyl-tRNA(Gln) amidotransferase subunit A